MSAMPLQQMFTFSSCADSIIAIIKKTPDAVIEIR